jgi:hypothetical protein
MTAVVSRQVWTGGDPSYEVHLSCMKIELGLTTDKFSFDRAMNLM